jgi:KaiC/GvpD/RAD55 family RecA-like ATPase
MMQTGVATLHQLLGGVLPGRIHLITGAPGSGKTSACLHFLRAGMVSGERTALLTLDRPTDLRSHARHLGHDLAASVRDGRITLIRYHKDFGRRIGAVASPAELVAELRETFAIADLRRMSRERRLRVAIDPVAPFLAEGASAGSALATLLDWLEEVGATALLTWNGDVAVADRRIERLLERAAVIARFHRLGGTRFRAEIVRARHTIADSPPIEFEIRPGLGLADAPAPETTRARRVEDPLMPALPVVPEGLLGDVGGGRGRPPA